DSTIHNGLDFGNKFKCIDIWTTIDTIGVPPVDVLNSAVVLPACYPWPYTIDYSVDGGATWANVFKAVVTDNVAIGFPCDPGKYRITRGHQAGYKPDRIYVNDTLRPPDGADSVIVDLPEEGNGISILFLNTASGEPSPTFRTFTADQFAGADQAKPVK